MPKFKVTVLANAIIGEEWLVEAESQDEAFAAVLSGDGELLRDWVAGDEENRELVDVEPA